MNKILYSIGIIFVCATAIAIWGNVGDTPAAVSANQQSSQKHDHAPVTPSPAAHDEDLAALFEEDDHEGHDHATETSSHQGHDHAAHGSAADICPAHGIPEEEDALCHGDNIGNLQPGEGMMVRLASAEVMRKTGIDFSLPRLISMAEGITVPGRVEFNRNRLAYLTPLANGVIRHVRVQPGAQVEKGQILAEIAMPEIASLTAQLSTAQARQTQTEAAFLREKDLLERGITSRQEYQQAEADYLAAGSAVNLYRQQLLNFGLSAADIQQRLQAGGNHTVVPLYSPFSGTVVEVKTAVGEAVSPTSPLFSLANLDRLWIELSLPESQIYQARIDASIQARFDGLPEQLFEGRIFQVGAVVDPASRTLKVMAEVENPDQRLKVGMFGDVRLLEEAATQTLAIPANALQTIDGFPFVFVLREADLFELRRVHTGEQKNGFIAILAGLMPGEQVASQQGFALKSEVLKARLGASCADH